MSDLERNEEMEDNTVILTDEDGNEVSFEFCASIMYEGKEYVVLLPDADDEVVILQVEEQEDSDDPEDVLYLSVDDDAVLEAVFELFKEQTADIYDFE